MKIGTRSAHALAVLAALSLVLGAAGLVMGSVEAPTADDDPALGSALPVETLRVRHRDSYVLRRVFSGRVEARRDSVLGFELAGRLTAVHVEEGAAVRQGQILARLDTERLEARRAELVAALAEAEARHALATATRARRQGVVEAGGVSRQGLDEAIEGERAAKAAVELARSRIASLDVDLRKTTLTAPFAGAVVARLADEGRVVDAGTPVLRLQAGSTPEVRIGVAGRSVDQLRVGEPYTLDWEGRPLRARLRAVLPLRAATTRTVDALFEPVEDGVSPRPGDLVTLGLASTVDESGAWLPVTALAEGERGLWSVYVAEIGGDGPPALGGTHRIVRRTVEVVHQEADRVYVRGALENGDRVVSTGLQRLVPGQWVRTGSTLVADGGRHGD